MLFRLSITLVFGIFVGCGGQSGSQEVSQDFDLKQNIAQDVASTVQGNDPSSKFQSVSNETVVKTITGKTGTLQITKTRDTNADGVTKTRILVYSNYTAGEGSRLSNLNGTLTYTLTKAKGDETQADITRTLKGSLSGSITNKDGRSSQFEKTFDVTFQHDPSDNCVTIGAEKDASRCKDKELLEEDAFKARGELVQAILAWVKKAARTPQAGVTIDKKEDGTTKITFEQVSPRDAKRWSNVSGTLTHTPASSGSPATLKGELIASVTKKDGIATVSVKIDVSIERDSKDNCLKLTGGFRAGNRTSERGERKDPEHCN